ncbi:hypothetical protein Hanom_Chr10g00892101 [Helianthus anomalus]
MDGVNEPNENGKIPNLLDPNAVKQTFGRKSQNWPDLRDENGKQNKTESKLFLQQKRTLPTTAYIISNNYQNK